MSPKGVLMSRSAPHLAAASALTAAVGLMAVTAVLDPQIEDGPKIADDVQHAASSVLVAGVATVALAVLLAVGVAALALVVHGQGRRLVVAAAVVTVAGAPGFVLDAAVELTVLDLAQSDAPRDVVASVAGVLDGGSAETIAFVGILLVWAGLLLLPIGLWRARAVPGPLAAVLFLAALVEPPAHQFKPAHIAAHLVLFAGYLLLAHRLWKRSTATVGSPATSQQRHVRATI